MLRFRSLRDLIRFRRRFDFEHSLISRVDPEVNDTPWRIHNYMSRYSYLDPATLRNWRSSTRRCRSSSRLPPSLGTETVKSERSKE